MNFTELKTELQRVSGRLDLSDTDLGNYINKGVKLLDEVSGLTDRQMRFFSSVQAGQNVISLPSVARSFTSIYIISTTERKRLTPTTVHEIRDSLNTIAAMSAQGVPEFYAPIALTLEQQQATGTNATFYGNWADFRVDNTTDIDGIMFDIAPDAFYSIEVIGNFYSPKLSSVQDNNYWSIRHDDLVISAAMYKIDIDNRNVMGANELLRSLGVELKEIYFDQIELETADKSFILGG